MDAHALSPDLLAALLDASTVGYAVYRVEDPDDPGALRLVYANVAANRTLGYDIRRCVGRTMREFMPQVLRTGLPGRYLDAWRQEEVLSLGVINATSQSGKRSWFRVDVVPLPDQHVAVVGEDVTQIKDYEQQVYSLNNTLRGRIDTATAELKAQNAALREANEALERFTFVASHDLQEPLRTLELLADLLLNSEGLSEEARDHATRICAAASRERVLIRDLLDYSEARARPMVFERIEMDELMPRLEAELAGALASAGATLRRGSVPAIRGDRRQIRVLFLNLLSNALKFRDPARPLQVEVDAERAGEQVLIHVRDNGMGIESPYLERIFQPFQRLHPADEIPGTGLGLALCRTIAQRHGGDVTVESEPGVGSTFTVTLPAALGE